MMIPNNPMYTTNEWATYHWQAADDEQWGEYLAVPPLRAEIRMERGGYRVTVQGVVYGVETALSYQTPSLKDARGWGHMQLTLARRVAQLESEIAALRAESAPGG